MISSDPSVWMSRRVEWILFATVSAILLGYVIYPSVSVFSQGLRFSNLQAVFSTWNSANVRALRNSVWISLWTVAGSGIVGTGLAYLFFRFTFPLKKVLASLAVLPLALPPLVGVLAFLFLYGESGILPRGIQALLGLENVPFSFNGLWAVLLVHIYSMYVFFYLFCSTALAEFDGSLLEASEDLGAGSFYTFGRIVLPHLRPSMVSASLLVFMISMASFTAPLFFAGSENFLTLQIFNYKTNGNMAYSATVSTVLTVICVFFLILIETRSNSRSTTTASKGAAPNRKSIVSGPGRVLMLAGGLIALILLLLPIATVVLVSFVKEGSWTYQVLPQQYTVLNYIDLIAQPDIFAPILSSVKMSAIATLGNIFFGVGAAVLIVKGRLPGRGLLRGLAILPFAIPGTVIAINLISTFNEPSVLTMGSILVGSFWMLPLAYFIRHIPLAFRSTVASLENYDDRLTEASSDLGASRFHTFWHVVLPTIAPGIAAGTLLTFVAALGEFVSSILLYVFDNRPISVEILAQLRLYNFGGAAAYSVFLMCLIAVSTVLIRRMAPSEGRIVPV